MDNKELEFDKEERIIYKILHQLDGLETALAHDTLHKVHLILSLTETPIDSAKLREVWFPEHQNQVKTQTDTQTNTQTMKLLIQNGREYHSMGANDQIELYLWVGLWYAKLVPRVCMYYKLPHEITSKVQKLTRTNLRNDFGGTPFEKNLFAFLAQHHPCKKDRKTGVYKILGAFVSNGFIDNTQHNL